MLRKKPAVSVAMAMMMAMMMASAGTASALPGNNGQGAARTFLVPQAHFGIGMAITHNFGGGCGGPCE